MSLTKPQIIEAIAQKTSTEKRTVEAILDSLAQLAYENAKDEFTVPGIGKLLVVDKKARTGRNPTTGEAIQIPAKKALKFKLSKVAKDAVLNSGRLTENVPSPAPIPGSGA